METCLTTETNKQIIPECFSRN
uniref:Uncharacterized protein n=1 Tax=Arundo donax TaxID=35708 RepID=A0A0A9GN80_ARUDO